MSDSTKIATWRYGQIAFLLDETVPKARRLREVTIHNSDYQSEEEMKGAVSRHFRERNEFFKENPKRVGKKIWEIDFFDDHENLKSGSYRDY